MTTFTGAATVDRFFVLMLENHSFDNVFANCGIPGVTVTDAAASNTYDGETYTVGPPGAPVCMPVDPGHEFVDALEQLCGTDAAKARAPWTPLPTIDLSGFVANFATGTDEIPKGGSPPAPSQWGDVMRCFDTPTQVPVLQQLAGEFAICDHWFSSLPGPTWPNRFFVHGASSGGWADSPDVETITGWYRSEQFVYPSGASIFDRLTDGGCAWRLYFDPHGPDGSTPLPMVAVIDGIDATEDLHPIDQLAHDLTGDYPYEYTFIEPNYGDWGSSSFRGGSSQHPTDGLERGEALIKTVYEAIRNSPIWERSALIVTYDEHGGFFDSVAPPPAVDPSDGSPRDLSINRGGFLFDRLGVRVPAVVVSPWVPQGTVDHTVYEHSSVPATLARRFDLEPMTARDAAAADLGDLLACEIARTDCPTRLVDPTPDPPDCGAA